MTLTTTHQGTPDREPSGQDLTSSTTDAQLLRCLHRQVWEATNTAFRLSLRNLSLEGEPVCFQLGLLLRVLTRRSLVPSDVARASTRTHHKEVSHGK